MRGVRLVRVATALSLVLCLAACGSERVESSASPEPPGGEAEGTPASDLRPFDQAPACTTDLDCQTCAQGLGCQCRVIAASDVCGPNTGRCAAEPCRSSSASCWAGRCALRPAVAGPCASDDECEVRAGDCTCDLYSALKTAPPAGGCPGQGCGARPSPNQWRARCDAEAARCVLERRPGT